MALEFLTFLSRDFSKLLDHGWDYDVEIRVGEGDHAKVYQAHSMILRVRSSYFAQALCTEWALSQKAEGKPIIFEKPKFSPFVFGVILRYIYGGIIHINKYDAAEIFDILIACDELRLSDLSDFLQTHLVSHRADWIRENFALTHRIASQHESLWHIQQFIAMIKEKHPEIIFGTRDFSFLDEDMIVSLLERDDIAIHEADIWSRIMEWGLAQMPPFTLDIGDWRQGEFNALEKILHKFIPHIRFFQMEPEEFELRVVPFKPIIPRRIYRDVVAYHQNKEDTSKIKSKIPQPRLGTWNWLVMNMKPQSIDSLLINVKHAALVAIWIDQKDMEEHFVTNPFEFKLLLRGSRDGFTSAAFHRLCDNQGPTLTVIRVKDTDEIIGGYNPQSWNSHSGFQECNDSFIFSMDETDLGSAFCSLVTDTSRAVKCSAKHGPVWGDGDLSLLGLNFRDMKLSNARHNSYEQKIRQSTDTFSVCEYEVFKVIRTHGFRKP